MQNGLVWEEHIENRLHFSVFTVGVSTSHLYQMVFSLRRLSCCNQIFSLNIASRQFRKFKLTAKQNLFPVVQVSLG